MILFDGIALEQIAPVKVVDIRVSPIQMNAQARQRPIAWGADFVRMTGGSRTVAIEFALLTNDRDMRQAQLAAITRWATGAGDCKPKRLTIPNKRGVYLEAACTALPEPSLRQWWESKLRIVFTTFDNPYWTTTEEKAVACGTPILVQGTAPPLMRIERTLSAAASSQSYSNGSETMTFSEIPAGMMAIDLNHLTAAVTSGSPATTTSIMANYTFDSRFLIPRTGVQTITGTGTVKWRERWQ